MSVIFGLYKLLYKLLHQPYVLDSTRDLNRVLCPTAPSSPTECLWANTTWWRRRLIPRPSCPRKLSFMRNGIPSLWPSGKTSISVMYKKQTEFPAVTVHYNLRCPGSR